MKGQQKSLKLDKVNGLRADRVQTQYVPFAKTAKTPEPVRSMKKDSNTGRNGEKLSWKNGLKID